jgi:cytochrome b
MARRSGTLQDTSMSRDVVPVWDVAVRLFHWSLAVALVIGYVTREEHYELHLQAGYAVLGLVSFRIVWGFIGTRHARFHNFVASPARAFGYVRGLVAGRSPRYLGHNPAGGNMVVLMLAALVTVSASGIALDAAENRAGPLAQWDLFLYTDRIETLHAVSADACVLLALVHLLGVALSSWRHRENLLLAMLTGRKRAPE